MWIQVRTIDGKQTARVDSLSKLTKIEDLRKLLIEHFDAEPSDQRLFFRGKQLEDGHTLFDYNVGLNDLIQLMVHVKPTPAIEASSTPKVLPKDSDENNSDKENKEPDSDGEVNQGLSSHSGLISEEGNVYKVGDIIDARDPTLGAWFEAKIVNIIKNKSTSSAQHASKAQDSCSSTQQTRGSSSSSDVLSQQCRHKIDEKDMNEAHTNMIKTVENEHDKGCKEHGFADNNDEHVSELLITKEKCNEDKSGDENGNVVTTNNPNLTNCKEGNSEAIPCIRQIETTGVLMPKISTSKNNVKEIDAVSSSLMLFMKDISDDLKKQGILCETAIDDGFIYKVVFEGYEDDVRDLSSKDIRPRARHLVHFDIVKEGQTIMANFNFEEPESRGFWYDCLITKKKYSRTQKELYATVYLGADLMPLENCRLIFLSELFEIEKPGTQLTERDVFLNPSASPAKRQNKPECDFCKDNPRRKCKHCACCVCGGKNNPERQLMCDECDQAYHLDCLNPPLTDVPEDDDWYCPECKRDENEVIKAGEKLKLSKKKSKMASANSSSCRDWGKGMACVGRTKQCTIVPSNHYGPIPGVEVGTMWKFRVQVSEAGVHRPHVAGIHGREEDGAYSIVLSGGYEDDTDNGGEFYYTGSGGRDLSGNKRTAEQSCDQKLTRMNKALAKNCSAAIDCKKGAAATDWRGGKPVRVVRNCKGRKHSKYAPEEGNRYDGIYKVVKYWPEKGISGFLVWRYLLRRDDPAPGPWTKEGQKYCQRLGLTMQYPEGYLANQEEKEKRLSENGSTKSSESDEDLNPQKHGHKRKLTASPKSEETKKSKTMPFQINKSIMKLIKEDTENQKLWKLAMNHLSEGKQKFLQQLEELFMCICCQELLYKPVTLQCSHNFCKPCIQRSFKAEVYSCPACRMDVPKNASQPVNVSLSKVLNHFYPGYEVGRE